MTGTSIQYVRNKDINRQKWDNCVSSAANGLIYGYAAYLDAMARHWDALVINDYEAVMPLPWNRKWGIRYLYQPPFTQQLGVFAKTPVSVPLLKTCLHEIAQHFKFAELLLNYGNALSELPLRNNFILPLNPPYAQLCRQYKHILNKNLKTSSRHHLQYIEDLTAKKALDIYRQQYASLTPHITDRDFSNFERLCLLHQQRGELVLRAAIDEQSALLATALLLRKKNRLYLLQTTVQQADKKKQAMHFLLDQVIREFSRQDMTLDFEGSDIPGIRAFFENFGGVNQPYFFLRINNLPWPFRFLKGPSSVVL